MLVSCESLKELNESTLLPEIRSILSSRVGRDSSVGITTRYGLDGPGVESQWTRLYAPVQAGSEAYPVSYTMGTVYFPGIKLPGRGVYHPPPSSAVVKERVQLCIYSPSGP